MAINQGSRPSHDIKRIFLNFAQKLFEEDPEFVWNIDPVITDIIIADKLAIELAVVEKKPAIILWRNTLGWANIAINQFLGPIPQKHLNPFLDERVVYSDLIVGNVTFNCVAKNNLTADYLANQLFMAISTMKGKFREHGIHKIDQMRVGEETAQQTDSDISLSVVPVNLRYTAQRVWGRSDRLSEIDVTINDVRCFYDTGFFTPSGQYVEFYFAPASGTTIEISYIDSITLQNKELTFEGDGATLLYKLPSIVYGYPILADSLIATPTLDGL